MNKSIFYSAIAALTLSLGLGLNPASIAMAQTAQAIQKININTASDVQLLKLPGFGPRMIKEVHEYRPFKNMAHFRKEMGKYLNKTQLDKLEVHLSFK